MSFGGTPFDPVKRTDEERFSRPNGLPCDGCDKTCLKTVDYYMVFDRVWYVEAGLAREVFCIACLETRLGRALAREDYLFTPVELADRIRKVHAGLPVKPWQEIYAEAGEELFEC